MEKAQTNAPASLHEPYLNPCASLSSPTRTDHGLSFSAARARHTTHGPRLSSRGREQVHLFQMFNRGHRRGGDVQLTNELFEKDNYPVEFYYPRGFPRGDGRVRICNNMLLLVYGAIGMNLNFLDTNTAIRKAMPAVIDSIRDNASAALRSRLDTACRIASALIGEVISFGGEYHIPHLLRAVVHAPEGVVHGCLSNWEDCQYLLEEYTVTAGLPTGVPQPEFSIGYLDFLGDPVYHLNDRMPIGKLNSFLSQLYAAIAHRANRISFLDMLHSLVVPQGSSEALSVNIHSAARLFESAVTIIHSRMGSNQLFMMPDRLRDRLMDIFSMKETYPRIDVSILYSSLITVARPVYNNMSLHSISLLSSLVGTVDENVYSLSRGLRNFLAECLPDLIGLDRRFYEMLSLFIRTDVSTIEDIPNLRVELTKVDFTQCMIAADATLGHLPQPIIQNLVRKLLEKIDYRDTHSNRLMTMLRTHLPNFTVLMDVSLASTLINLAGGVESLVTFSLSDLKRLGYAKLLHRAGAIFHRIPYHIKVNRKRRMASVVAEMALAALRVDVHSDAPTSSLGKCLLAHANRLTEI